MCAAATDVADLNGFHWRHAALDHDGELPATHIVRQHRRVGPVKQRHTLLICLFKNNSLSFCRLGIALQKYLRDTPVHGQSCRYRCRYRHPLRTPLRASVPDQ